VYKFRITKQYPVDLILCPPKLFSIHYSDERQEAQIINALNKETFFKLNENKLFQLERSGGQ